jgi:glycosyltransferase involved in cell wall biosynthesis
MKVVILIPAYQPGQELLSLLQRIKERDAGQKVIIVNDGSTTDEARRVFETIAKKYGFVDIVKHSVNLGKGQALKTGFNHFLLNYSEDHIGVVTADADGQHVVDDIFHVAELLQANPRALCLGGRVLGKDVPFRRLFGNKLTVLVFKLVTGISLMDTQTGLRGIPADFLYELMRSPESGYDFELDMLITATRKKIKILETPIQTIYMENNAGSHFNYFRDSFKIYFVFLRFSLLSLATAAIDYLVFSLSFLSSQNIFFSIVIARLLAGSFQFTFSKYWVFKSSDKIMRELLKYVLLVCALMLLSYGLITPMVLYLGFSPYISKVIAEGLIFLLSFAAQDIFVYAHNPAQTIQEKKTNWDVYYDTPFKTAFFSRRFTERKIHWLIDTFKSGTINSIYELGGGNSYFFSKLRAKHPNVRYVVLDNNQHGLDMFSKQYADDKNIQAVNDDVLEPKTVLTPADVVFSIGLIEHFSTQGTAKAIQTHFSCVKPGSLVIITFPTPTWLYVIARRITEAVGAWRFPDERPLLMGEVLSEVEKYGKVVHTSINWPIVFTQGVVAVLAK